MAAHRAVDARPRRVARDALLDPVVHALAVKVVVALGAHAILGKHLFVADWALGGALRSRGENPLLLCVTPAHVIVLVDTTLAGLTGGCELGAHLLKDGRLALPIGNVHSARLHAKALGVGAGVAIAADGTTLGPLGAQEPLALVQVDANRLEHIIDVGWDTDSIRAHMEHKIEELQRHDVRLHF